MEENELLNENALNKEISGIIYKAGIELYSSIWTQKNWERKKYQGV